MLRRHFLAFVLMLVGVMIAAAPVAAQEVSAEEPFAITVDAFTQAPSSLRLGPGTTFERVDVVPASTTLTAIGRTVGSDWIQVIYNDQLGWIAARLLTWRGDWLSLPADGIDPVPFARRTGALATTNRGTFYYTTFSPEPGTYLGTLPPGTQVELTGRYGSGQLIWLQFHMDEAYYWAGAWNFNIEGIILDLPDGASISPVGRVLAGIRRNILRTQDSYVEIRSIWRRLDAGDGVSCNDIPRQVSVVDFLDSDLASQPVLTPAARAIEEGVVNINNAIDLFEQACASPDRVITRDLVDAALAEIDSADRNFTIAETLFEPLAEFSYGGS